MSPASATGNLYSVTKCAFGAYSLYKSVATLPPVLICLPSPPLPSLLPPPLLPPLPLPLHKIHINFPFFPRTIQECNPLPADIVQSDTIGIFKTVRALARRQLWAGRQHSAGLCLHLDIPTSVLYSQMEACRVFTKSSEAPSLPWQSSVPHTPTDQFASTNLIYLLHLPYPKARHEDTWYRQVISARL